MRPLHVRRHVLTGLLTFVPIWLTWILFKAVFSLLSAINLPWVAALSASLARAFPDSAGWLGQDWLVSLLAFLSTLLFLYALGFAASLMVGRRLLEGLERLIDRIPVVHSIYGGAKKLMHMLQSRPDGTQRVVLIDFPSPHLKAVGFVTRVFRDADDRELAAVYVPTTPNPTGGYLEIVPVGRLVPTDWTMDQAMAYILSAGAAVPDRLDFSVPDPAPPGSGRPPA